MGERAGRLCGLGQRCQSVCKHTGHQPQLDQHHHHRHVGQSHLRQRRTTLFENSPNYNSSTTGFGFFPDDSADCGIANSMETGVHGNVGYTANCYAQPTSGVWHHIAVIYDKTQQGPNVISLYLDGVLQTPNKQPISVTNTNAFGDNQLYLFSRGGTTGYAAGEMYDLRLYDVALTASQIEQIYQQGVGTLTSLAVTPANASIAKGLTEQYTAIGTYSNGSTQNLTSSVTWSSTNSAVASINSAGLATSASTGSTTIRPRPAPSAAPRA